ncbi:hypothetical protein CBL_07269 [Carabus blaptoides fortunei]
MTNEEAQELMSEQGWDVAWEPWLVPERHKSLPERYWSFSSIPLSVLRSGTLGAGNFKLFRDIFVQRLAAEFRVITVQGFRATLALRLTSTFLYLISRVQLVLVSTISARS